MNTIKNILIVLAILIFLPFGASRALNAAEMGSSSHPLIAEHGGGHGGGWGGGHSGGWGGGHGNGGGWNHGGGWGHGGNYGNYYGGHNWDHGWGGDAWGGPTFYFGGDIDSGYGYPYYYNTPYENSYYAYPDYGY